MHQTSLARIQIIIRAIHPIHMERRLRHHRQAQHQLIPMEYHQQLRQTLRRGRMERRHHPILIRHRVRPIRMERRQIRHRVHPIHMERHQIPI